MNAHPSSLSDRELLELAAKAAGQERSAAGDLWSNARGSLWNPLKDDGDALRLAVKLGLEVQYYCRWGDDKDVADCHGELEETGIDPYAATRRAIVRAAAAIGQAK